MPRIRLVDRRQRHLIRRCACLVLLGMSILVVNIATTSQLGSTASAGLSRTPFRATLTDANCPNLLGTVEWTGFFGYYNQSSNSNPWGVNLTEAPDGSLAGAMTGPPGFIGDPIVGSVSCSQITFGILPSLRIAVTGNVTVSGSALAASGTWIDGTCCNGTWIATAVLGPVVSIAPASLPGVSGPVSYAVTVTGSGATPTGSVEVSDDQGGSCSISSLTGGEGSCAINETASLGPYLVTAEYSGDSNYAQASGSISNTTVLSSGGIAATGTDQVIATATGGTDGVDSVTESQYGADPVGSLTDGSNYFDVAVSAGSTFSSVVVRDCNNVTALTYLDWWNPNAGVAGAWRQIAGNPDPTYSPGPPACVSTTLDDSTSPSLSQLSGTVFAAAPSRAITSADSVSTSTGHSSSAIVTAIGSPTPSIKTKGKMPIGMRLVDNKNGTARFVGEPRSAGAFHLSIIASYGRGKAKQTLTQDFTLFVFQHPTFIDRAKVTATIGHNYRLTVRSTGYPRPGISESGVLPNGITFRPSNDGTATLSGAPTVARQVPIRSPFEASNGEGSPVNQRFTLTVKR